MDHRKPELEEACKLSVLEEVRIYTSIVCPEEYFESTGSALQHVFALTPPMNIKRRAYIEINEIREEYLQDNWGTDFDFVPKKETRRTSIKYYPQGVSNMSTGSLRSLNRVDQELKQCVDSMLNELSKGRRRFQQVFCFSQWSAIHEGMSKPPSEKPNLSKNKNHVQDSLNILNDNVASMGTSTTDVRQQLRKFLEGINCFEWSHSEKKHSF